MKSIKKLYEEYMSNLKQDMEEKRETRSNGVRVEYAGLSHSFKGKRIRTIRFEVKDPNGSGKKHKVRIQIPELREIIKLKKNQNLAEAIQTSLKAGKINVECSCPDHLYKGYRWMADSGDYGIVPENIPPNIMNPNLEGSVCKHVGGVFNQINKFIPDVIVDLRTYLLKRRKTNKR